MLKAKKIFNKNKIILTNNSIDFIAVKINIYKSFNSPLFFFI